MLTEIKLFFRNALIKVVEFYLKAPVLFPKRNTLLILRLDEIGDYVLFRNFIEHIKLSDKYKGYKIFLAGNERWKDLAEEFDGKYIDGFIWINLKEFKSRANWWYRLKNLLKLKSMKCEYLFIPNDTFSEKIKYFMDRIGIKKVIKKENDSVYLQREITDFLNEKKKLSFADYQETFFQFYRNKKYIEKVTESISNIKKPYFNKIENKKSSYGRIVIFPGAGHDSRTWPAENFGELCKKIKEIAEYEIIICGDISDKEKAVKIKQKENSIVDLTSKTSLPDLVKIIKESDLLISNETSAVHIAASVNTKTICLSNGNHFGRFNPYPDKCADFIYTIYPDEITSGMNDYGKFVKDSIIISDISMKKISVEKVIEKVSELLSGSISGKNPSETLSNQASKIRTS